MYLYSITLYDLIMDMALSITYIQYIESVETQVLCKCHYSKYIHVEGRKNCLHPLTFKMNKSQKERRNN